MALNIRNKQSDDGGLSTQPANDSLDDSLSSEVNEKIDITVATLLPNLNKNVNMKYLATRPRVNYVVSTVNKSDLMTNLGRKLKSVVPPLISFSPSLENTSRRLLQANDSNILSRATSVDGTVQLIQSYGISSNNLRPEIVSTVDFNPIWRASPNGVANLNLIVGKRYTDTGLFLKFQHQTKQLRQDTFLSILKNVRKSNSSQKNPYQVIRNEYLNETNLVQNNLNYLKGIYDNITTVKNAFEIRKLPEQNYQIVQGNRATIVPTFKQYLVEVLKRTELDYESYSETKLFLQILYDLQLQLENVSKIFLDANLIEDRGVGRESPIRIERYGRPNFSLQDLASRGSEIKNASDPEFITAFSRKLPITPDDRIKLLTYLLAKEYSISKALGDNANTDLFRSFGIENLGNPFPTLFGDIKDDVLTPPSDKTSLGYLAYGDVPGNPNINILMFENKFIENEADASNVWIPGNVYFSEQIINLSGPTWNTTAFANYVSQYNKTVQSAIDNINRMLGIDTNLNGIELNKMLLNAFYTSFDKLTQEEENVATALSRDPAKYQQKLTLEAQKRDLTAQLEEMGTMSDSLNVRARARDGGDVGSDVSSYIDNYNSEENALRERLKARISEINQKLSELALPSLPETLKLTTEQALIMSMFNFAGRNLTFAKLLFGFCITAGMIRNTANDQNSMFVILSKKDINILGKLPYAANFIEDFRAEEPLPSNGTDLIEYLKYLSRQIATEYVNSFRPNSATQTGGEIDSGTQLLVYLSAADVPDILLRAALGQGAVGNVNLIYQYIKLANTLFTLAQTNGINNHLLPDGTGRTRFNQISVSTQLLMLFEIFVQYAKKYSFIERKFSDRINILGEINVIEREAFPPDGTPGTRPRGRGEGARFRVERNRDGIGGNESTEIVNLYETTAEESVSSVLNVVALGIDAGRTAQLQKAVSLLTTSPKEEDIEQERTNSPIFASLENNKNKIEKEYTNIQNGLGLYKVLGQNFTYTLNQILQFFTQEGLKEFLKTGTINNLELIKNISQLRISSQIFDDLKKRTAVPEKYVPPPEGESSNNADVPDIQMIVSDNVIPEEYSIMEKFFTLPAFVPNPAITEETISRNFKILSIGIPTGFNKNLIDKVSVGEINAINFKDRQADLIYINIYVRNGKYPQLVFKPIKFVFDISLFATKDDIVKANPQSGEGYVSVVNRMTIKDFENPFAPLDVSLADIRSNPKYNILDEYQKQMLFINHVNAYVLNSYIYLMTGARISEDIFLSRDIPDRVLNPKAKTLIDTYVKAIQLPPPPGDLTVPQILASNEINDDVKDLYRLFTYGSLVFNQGEVNNRVMNSKIFDRIFHMPISTYLMEIDMEKTLMYLSPEEFSRITNDKKKFVQVNPRDMGIQSINPIIFMIDANSNEFVFKDIFVEIETVLKTDTIQRVRTYTDTTRTSTPQINITRIRPRFGR